MKINTTLLVLIKRLTKLIFNYNADYETYKTVSKINFLLKHNGTKYTVKYMKAVRLHITRYMCGKPLLHNSDRVSLINGFPKEFLFLKPLIDSKELNKIKTCLTLLNISRGLVKKNSETLPPDYSTIVAPYKGINYTIPVSFIKQ